MVWNLPAISVSVIVNMTDLRGLPMKQCTTRKESGKQMMSQNLNQKMSPMQTSGVSDSHARISPLQENSGDLSESEVGYITTLLTSSKAKKKVISPHTFLLRTLRTCYQLIQASTLPAFCLKWTKRGMTVGGRCLIQKTSESPKTGSVFIIANLRSRGGREILPLCGENAATLNQLVGGMQGYRVYGTDGISATLVGNAGGVGAKTGLYLMGNLNPSGHGQGGNVYHEDGIAPTVTVNKGCGTRIFIDQSNHAPKLTENARCITARYTSGMVNHTAMNSAVMEVHPVLTPERMEKRQNGRRMKEDGEPMFTLTSQDRHGVFVCEKVQQNEETMLRVRNGTKQGYDEAHVGDGISLAYPESDTRRGRVGKGCSQTLDCSGQMGTLMKCGRIRRLTPRECFRLQGFPDVLFDKAASVNSDAQLYKQAGNAVTATVAFAVAMSLPESREN